MGQFFYRILLGAALLPCAVNAEQVDDINIPDEAQIADYDGALVLNGAGVRKKFFISVYVGALYLPQRQVGVGSLLQAPPANRVLMHFVYSKVDKGNLDEGWIEGFEKNLSAEQYAALKPRLDSFTSMFGDMREGDVVWLDYVPGRGTRVSINGSPVGDVQGEDFNSGLLSVWLGAEPVTQSLKNALVGVDKG